MCVLVCVYIKKSGLKEEHVGGEEKLVECQLEAYILPQRIVEIFKSCFLTLDFSF